MKLYAVTCAFCSREFFKDKGHLNENKRLNQKLFCSKKCLSLSRNKQQKLICENPPCGKSFFRQPHDISPHNYCSHSCSAKITNSQRTRIKKPKIIKPKLIASHNKESIILAIRTFAHEHNRIPVKREMWNICAAAKISFGSWNNAIRIAGFEPNPVKFANKQIANDGHVCDSIAERTIDDYLFKNNVSHQTHFPYPEGSYTADFKIGNNYVEYFGLSGEIPKYDNIKELKKIIASKYKIKLLEIYPRNLYRKNGLDEIFKTKKLL